MVRIMKVEIPPIAVCPHCGFESDDEELCRACGKLTGDDIPVRNVSIAHVFGSLVSRLQEKGFGVDEKNELIDIDASDDPGLAHLPGNSYHYTWLASHDKD